MSTLEQAISIATAAHTGQLDKARAPYIFHPLRVMQAAYHVGGLEGAIAGVLHDVIEDSPAWSLPHLAAAGFGPRILAALEALTRRPGEPYAEFIERCRQDPLARLVKIADLNDHLDPNRGPIAGGKDERAARYRAALALLQLQEVAEEPPPAREDDA